MPAAATTAPPIKYCIVRSLYSPVRPSRACSSGASVACQPKYNSSTPRTRSTIPVILFVPITPSLRCRAFEVGRVVRIAVALVARDLRMRAQRPRHRDLAVAHRSRRDRRRLLALLDPARERRHPIDLIGAHAAAAMTDAGQHEEAHVLV